ncbi:hypothetical protein DNX69_15600 [Rhodopseudomonas palustris]|uniref:Uncharacterized protein n=1 Tax=Rhodopseudomonas palustris TaxID=1076 RepID=A0A323UED7_RHOPL|nr:hypothetical protein [Rhodopseudomonas palustris]PZA10771.1 hypothetical protein DNX69_15600 [Rhodopseudomonas palustris]
MARQGKLELRQAVFAAADQIALERGLAAVGVDSVFAETGGGRQAVEEFVKAWKARQQVRAEEMPDSIRLMAKRIAEEAWILAAIAHGSLRSGTDAPGFEGPDRQVDEERRFSSPNDGGRRRSVKPKVSSHQTGKGEFDRLLQPKTWQGVMNPRFAEAVSHALAKAARPLYARELESCSYPPSRLDRFDAAKPGRAIMKALDGAALVRLKPGTLWFEGAEVPERPKRKPKYTSVGTDLSKRRRLAPDLIEQAVQYIRRTSSTVRFVEIWDHVNPPEGFSKSWLRHALHLLSKEEDARILRPDDGLYRRTEPTRKPPLAPKGDK